MHIYTLQLEDNKYYVGTTSDMDRRISEHKNGKGSEWTKQYKFVRLLKVEEVNDEDAANEETKTTFKLMLDHGINNVRGAAYCKTSDYTKEELIYPIGHTLGISYDCVKSTLKKDVQCHKCNEYGHYGDQCFTQKWINYKNRLVTCYNCGKNGHYANTCYSNKANDKFNDSNSEDSSNFDDYDNSDSEDSGDDSEDSV